MQRKSKTTASKQPRTKAAAKTGMTGMVKAKTAKPRLTERAKIEAAIKLGLLERTGTPAKKPAAKRVTAKRVTAKAAAKAKPAARTTKPKKK